MHVVCFAVSLFAVVVVLVGAGVGEGFGVIGVVCCLLCVGCCYAGWCVWPVVCCALVAVLPGVCCVLFAGGCRVHVAGCMAPVDCCVPSGMLLVCCCSLVWFDECLVVVRSV